MGIARSSNLLGKVTVLVFIFFFALSAKGKYGGGTGEPNDPYLIYDANQMNAIGADSNDWDKHFLLCADIDLSEYTGTEFNLVGNGRFLQVQLHEVLEIVTKVLFGEGVKKLGPGGLVDFTDAANQLILIHAQISPMARHVLKKQRGPYRQRVDLSFNTPAGVRQTPHNRTPHIQ